MVSPATTRSKRVIGGETSASLEPENSAGPAWLQVIEQRPVMILALLTAAMLLPWIAKPFHIDDPMYIWAGEHILQGNVVDFYGFRATWTGHEKPMHQLMQNPPLTSYYIALIGLVAGMNEVALHAAFIIPAVLTVLGTWRLAKAHCRWPALAAAIVAITPVFVLCGTTIMADMILTCCWVWAVHFWDQGLKRHQWRFVLGAGSLAALAFVAKYPGMNLLPLLLAYALIRKAPVKYLAALLIPIAVMVGYELLTRRLYGSGLLTEAFSYAQHVRMIRDANPIHKMFVAVCFTGGCFAPALLLSPFLWSMRGMIVGAAMFLGVMIGLLLLAPAIGNYLPHMLSKGVCNWPMIVQLSLWATAGAGVIAMCALDFLKRRDASASLLALWIFGTIAFAGIMNWSVNGRSLLPMAPAVAIVIVRQLERRASLEHRDSARVVPVSLAVAAALALAVSWADVAHACASHRAVDRVMARYGQDPERLWFQGHWGFQHYIQRRGARPLVIGTSPIKKGDFIVIPLFGSSITIIKEPFMTIIDELAEPACPWLSLMNPAVGAGFYTDAAGPLPFVFGKVPPERYLIQRVNVGQAAK